MSTETIKEILMKREGIPEEEAELLIEETTEEILELLAMQEDSNIAWEDATEILRVNLGLEPDYLQELIFN